MDTQTQIERLIELAIIQRSELKQLVEQLPQLREHLNAEVEKVFEETEPQLRAELEDWTTKQTADKTAALGVALEAKITDLAKSLEISTQARYNAIIAEREENSRLAAQAEQKIAEHAASLPSAVKDIVTAELARFPRAGEIDQLRKEFAEPKSLNPRGKWQAGETYNKLDFVTINGDSYASNIDNNRTRPSRSSADWTLVAARGTGGGGGPTSLSELTTVPSDGDVLIGSGTSWVTSNLTAGAGISITVGPGAITISATDGDITLDDGTAASPSLHFTNDPDTGIYRPAANTLGISVSGTQVAYFDENGLTVPSAGVVAGGSIHAGNGNANNPSLSFDGDQDTGFFRHQADGIAIALGGTQYADFHSSGFSITPSVTIVGALTANGTSIPASKTLVVTTDKISALSATTSAELAGKITDETGTGSLVFANTPTLVTPNIGAATGTSVNLSGAGTFGGNLTVSGTGTHTFGTAGSSSPVTVLATGTTDISLRAVSTAADSFAFMSIQNDARQWTMRVNGADSDKFNIRDSTAGSDRLTIDSAGAVTLAGNLTVSGTGNSSVAGTLLVATTTNSSNGKVQLATHTTSAGGIGFGTVTSLHASSVSGCLELTAASGTTGGFKLYNTTNQRGQFVYSGTDVYIDASTLTGQLIFRTNGSTTALTLDSSSNATFAGTVTPTGGIVGVTTNSNAAAGNVGEIVTAVVDSGSGVALTSAVVANATSISLTAGDWDVTGVVGYDTSGATVSQFLQGLNNASASLGPTGTLSKVAQSLSGDTNNWYHMVPTYRFSLSATSTVYLLARATFSAGTVSAFGAIRARRVR